MSDLKVCVCVCAARAHVATRVIPGNGYIVTDINFGGVIITSNL